MSNAETSPAPRHGPSSDEAIRRVNRVLGPRRRIALVVMIVTTLALLVGGWYASRRHLAAMWSLGIFKGGITWHIDAQTWSHLGWTEASLRQRFSRNFSGLSPWNPLAPLTDLHRLEALDIGGNPNLSDNDLLTLADLPHLRELSLDRPSWATPTGWNWRHYLDTTAPTLARLTNLETLDLSGTDISDAGVARLTTLRRLKSLHLSGTAITDASLAVFKDLPALIELDVANTKVTPKAAMRFQLDRPEVTVLADLPTDDTAPGPGPEQP
jgi:hypothetical protein